VAESPRIVVGSVTNALYNLATTPGARPHEWAASLLQAADACPDTATLLKAGQVAAWRAGLAHYRLSALEICAQLAAAQPAIARLALGLPAQPDTPPAATIINRLRADPWLHPDSDLPPEGLPTSNFQLRIVARVGAFRGFGGLFLRPPIVEPSGEHFLVTDGDDTWLLVADACGATFHRAAGTPSQKTETPFALAIDGAVRANGKTQVFPELVNYTSCAASRTTLAVTTPLSHAVSLVAFTA